MVCSFSESSAQRPVDQYIDLSAPDKGNIIVIIAKFHACTAHSYRELEELHRYDNIIRSDSNRGYFRDPRRGHSSPSLEALHSCLRCSSFCRPTAWYVGSRDAPFELNQEVLFVFCATASLGVE